MESLNPYPAYKDSGVPWLGEVPAHWEVPRLGALLQERGEVNIFDRGGTIEELRERCLEGTQLEPPKPPQFNRRVLRFLKERGEQAKAGAAAE